MPNLHLQCHCNVLIANIHTFLHTIENTCCAPANASYKKEQKYIKKLDKDLRKLLDLLNQSP